MKVLIGTDLLLSLILKGEYFEGMEILYKWIDSLRYARAIDAATVSILTRLVDANCLAKYKGYTLIKELSRKSQQMCDLESELTKSVNGGVSYTNKIKNNFAQLNVIENRNADFLITENQFTMFLARKLGLDDRVYDIESFIEKCAVENREKDPKKGEIVQIAKFHTLDLEDPFFNTFKHDYGNDYIRWYNEKYEDDVYVSKAHNGLIKALLKLKVESCDEDYSDVQPVFNPKKRLKISTFKVSYSGSRLGERFMRIIFEEALKEEVQEIYVTLFNNSPDRRKLVKLLTNWGFDKHGTKSPSGEHVYVRDLEKITGQEICKDYPFHSRRHQAYLIPLHKIYATDLFPDSDLDKEKTDYAPYKNAIRKVVVLDTQQKEIQSRDILLFYQKTSETEERKIVASGIVEEVYDNIEGEYDFILKCRKRSNLSDSQLRQCWNKCKPNTTIINFLFASNMDKEKINQKKLEELGIDTNALQSQHCYPLSKEQFSKIIKDTRYEKDLIID